MAKDEKKKLEKSALEYFIKAYPKKLDIVKHKDKPDFTLEDPLDKSKIGVEVAHLYYDHEEAKILFRRSTNKMHKTMSIDGLIKKLNNLLVDKINKLNQYTDHKKNFLIIRVASPIFDLSSFKMYSAEIHCPPNNYSEIWLILDSNDNQRWTALYCIKSNNIT